MTMTPQDGDRLVARLVEARDAAGDEGGEAFLARLVLLLAHEVDDPERVMRAVAEAAAGAAS
jgi:hypothetical protein